MPRSSREERIEYNRQWRLKNPQYMSEYRKKHKERDSETGKIWRSNNVDRIRDKNCKRMMDAKKHEMDLETKRKWRLKNPGKQSLYSRKRIELIKNAGLLKREDLQKVYETNIIRFNRLTCELCLKPVMFGDDSLEHKLPLARGGTNSFDNLAVAHDLCNRKKNAKTLDEWFRLNPHLVSTKVVKGKDL